MASFGVNAIKDPLRIWPHVDNTIAALAGPDVRSLISTADFRRRVAIAHTVPTYISARELISAMGISF